MKSYIFEFDTLRMTFVKLNKFELLRSTGWGKKKVRLFELMKIKN
jgi:hypothetical protein